MADKGGYVQQIHGQRQPNDRGRPIQLADGQTVERIDFGLSRGSVIAGRLVDEFGEPIAGAMVLALKPAFYAGQRRLMPAGSSRDSTDDIGQFRLFGLPPGEYVISAAALHANMMGAQSNDRSGYAPTYYPGTSQASEAERITVGLGEELSGITFALVSARTARISGAVVDSSGRPPVNAMVMLDAAMASPGMWFGAGRAPVGPGGLFTMTGVTPGDYRIVVQTAEPDGEFASMPISVSGTDITGLSIVTSRGATARGRVTVEGRAPAGYRPDALQIYPFLVQPAGGRISVGGGPARPKEDGSFEVTRIAQGAHSFRIGGLPRGWALKKMTDEGTDVTDTGYEFKGAEEVDGFQIVLTNRTTEVSGTVKDERGGEAREFTVVPLAADRERWKPESRFIRASSGLQGRGERFTIGEGEKKRSCRR